MDFLQQVLVDLPLALGPSWLDPEQLIRTFGTIGILAIVFIESGLLIGFFLPGDSLLFTAGLLSAAGVLPDTLQRSSNSTTRSPIRETSAITAASSPSPRYSRATLMMPPAFTK
jgi:hypothetical protein